MKKVLDISLNPSVLDKENIIRDLTLVKVEMYETNSGWINIAITAKNEEGVEMDPFSISLINAKENLNFGYKLRPLLDQFNIPQPCQAVASELNKHSGEKFKMFVSRAMETNFITNKKEPSKYPDYLFDPAKFPNPANED